MERLARALRLVAALAVIALAACKPDSGPEEIKYGRDTCALCGMIISDSHYAAEVRGGPDHKIVKFDDVGEAAVWIEIKGWGLGPATEFWVMNSEDGKTWLDARKAYYRHGDSPMSYDLAAVPKAGDDTIDFDAMRRRALERAKKIGQIVSGPEPKPETEGSPK